ncbi:hypothetical protein A6R73_02545 [Xanthomonas translucens pv. poae]|uniref:Uncharacterized protein n=1 Tax=Xanthomonas graminis pv. poae TaxID=227946 RepID=A0A199P223_9XANT|nr:hypothetical protein A6R73_02545 [Xanthomonas translucens pv. poae]
MARARAVTHSACDNLEQWPGGMTEVQARARSAHAIKTCRSNCLQPRQAQWQAFRFRTLSRLKPLLQCTQQAIRRPCRSGFSRDRVYGENLSRLKLLQWGRSLSLPKVRLGALSAASR